jgi:TonB-dependent receptor
MSSNHLRPAARHSGARTRRALLAVSASLPILAAAAAPALAQEAEVAEVVVTATPIRDSIEKSLEIQKASDNIVNVIASDTIGRFPDATAAGALARLPGVGVQRDQGQERYIHIRGAPTRWTTVALDGVNVLGAENRIFRFDSVPAAQISELTLSKTLLPNMPAEALAGRVDIRTFSPLDNPGFHGFFDAGGGFVDMGDGPVEQYSGRLSWANDTWGVSLIGSHYSFEQHTDNSEPRFDDVGITQLRITKYIITRQTESYSGRIEYAPNDNHRFRLTHLKTEFNDFEERNQNRFQYDRAYQITTRNFDTFEGVGVPQDATFEYGTFSNSVKLTNLHGDHEWGGWKGNWDLAYTETEFNSDIPLVTQQTAGGLSSTPTLANALLLPSIVTQVNAVSGGFPHNTMYDTILVGGVPTRGPARTSLDQMSLNEEFATESSSLLETDAFTAKGDISREWESFGADALFSAGFQFDDRSQDSRTVALVRPDGTVVSGNRNGFNLRTIAAQLGIDWNPYSYVTTVPWDTNFDHGFTVGYMHNPAMRSKLDELMDAARAANAAGANYAVYDWDTRADNTVDEKVLSGYVMNRWRWDRHTLVGGLRVERTEIETDGLANAGGVLQPLSFSSEETNIFPSLHYTFDYSDDLKLRAAFISGQARPSLAGLRATVSVNDNAQTISGGNPFAVPETAYGLDGSVEWYFGPASLLAASAFHREVKDVLFSSTQVVGDDSYNFDGVDRSQYLISATVNGGDGYLSGVEFIYNQPFTFLPGPLSGFGFQGSVSFTKGEFETPEGPKVEFPGTSDRITSATLFYENYGLSTRLSYQHRTAWLDEVFPSGSSDNSNLYWDATTRWDLSIRYEINPNFSVFFDGNNLTDERGVRYQGVENRPYEIEGFGRKFMAGVRATF